MCLSEATSSSNPCVANRLVHGIANLHCTASTRRMLLGFLLTPAMSALGATLAVGEPVRSSGPVAPASQAAPVQISNEELLRNLQCMEQRVRALEGQLKAQSSAPAASGMENPAQSAQPPAAELPKPFPMRTVRVPQNSEPAAKPASEPGAKPAV